MPDLPPPLPEGFKAASPPISTLGSDRWRVGPLNERKESLFALVGVLSVFVVGIYVSILENAGRWTSFGEVLQNVAIYVFMSLNAWFIVWVALGTVHIIARILVSSITVTLFFLYFGLGGTQNLTTPMILAATYMSLLRLFRWRIMKAEKLFVTLPATHHQSVSDRIESNHSDKDFVLIPASSFAEEIDATARWHLYRRSPRSTRGDAFRPAQFQLKQLFKITCVVGLIFLTIRVIVAITDSRYATDSTGMILMSAGMIAPMLCVLLTLAMWCALGRSRIFVKYAVLVLLTFTFAFIYHFLDTPPGVAANLEIDFKLSLLTTRDTGMAFCVASLWMVVARAIGYRLVRLPLSIEND